MITGVESCVWGHYPKARYSHSSGVIEHLWAQQNHSCCEAISVILIVSLSHMLWYVPQGQNLTMPETWRSHHLHDYVRHKMSKMWATGTWQCIILFHLLLVKYVCQLKLANLKKAGILVSFFLPVDSHIITMVEVNHLQISCQDSISICCPDFQENL